MNKKNHQTLIKIVFLTPRLFMGGAERLMIDIFSQLDQSKFKVCWCCLEDNLDQPTEWRAELEQSGIEVVTLSSGQRSNWRIVRWWKLLVVGWRLLVYLRKVRPNILQTQLFADVYRLIGWLARVPTIIGVEHNLDYDEPQWVQLVKRASRSTVSGVIAVSEAVKQDVIVRYRYSEQQVTVIYNGINWSKFFKPIKKAELTNQSVWQIGAIGRLTQQKGFDLLINALAQLPSDLRWFCSIAGDGPQASYLQDLIKKRDLVDRVRLVGRQMNVPSFLSQLDYLVVPSRWEGLGLVILEAGAAGVPVLASRVDGIKEIVKHQVNGYLVEPNSVEQLTNGLTDVLSLDKLGQQQQWASNLQNQVKDNFSLELAVKKYQQYYYEQVQKN